MKYRITNTTVKAKVLDRNGKDLRTTEQKVGFNIKFRADNRDWPLYPGGTPAIVNEIPAGLTKLAQNGDITIEQIKNVATVLRDYASTAQAPAQAPPPSTAPRRATATEMGKDTHGTGKKSGTQYEGAVNPDGDPNFIVKAGKTRRSRKVVTEEKHE